MYSGYKLIPMLIALLFSVTVAAAKPAQSAGLRAAVEEQTEQIEEMAETIGDHFLIAQ